MLAERAVLARWSLQRTQYDRRMEKQHSGGRRIAFFGGSFDPPHRGHVAVARAARDALHLDEVLFAPVGAQPLKPVGSTASFDDRVAMTRLAIAGEPGFALSLVDAPRATLEPNYTFDALVEVQAELPSDGQLYCLMGADSLLSFSQWRRAAEIPFVGALIVASRPGESLEDVTSAMPSGLTLLGEAEPARLVRGGGVLRTCSLQNAAGSSARLYLLSGIEVDISATQVRQWLHKRKAFSDDPATDVLPLPSAVLNYIETHGLYR